jgi:hypothetical protein
LAVVAGFAWVVVGVSFATPLAEKLLLPPPAEGTQPEPTPTYLAVNLAYGGLFAVVGGIVTAYLARRAPLTHAAVLAAIFLVLGVVYVFRPMQGWPSWYPYVNILIGPGGVLLGGWLRARRRPTQAVAG